MVISLKNIREGLMYLLLPTVVRKKKILVQKLCSGTVLKPFKSCSMGELQGKGGRDSPC